jgi:hypothetical protein
MWRALQWGELTIVCHSVNSLYLFLFQGQVSCGLVHRSLAGMKGAPSRYPSHTHARSHAHVQGYSRHHWEIMQDVFFLQHCGADKHPIMRAGPLKVICGHGKFHLVNLFYSSTLPNHIILPNQKWQAPTPGSDNPLSHQALIAYLSALHTRLSFHMPKTVILISLSALMIPSSSVSSLITFLPFYL